MCMCNPSIRSPWCEKCRTKTSDVKTSVNIIDGVFLVTNSEPQVFYNALSEKIKTLQDDGQEVEIQYSTDKVEESNGRNGVFIKINHSALILGRRIKMEEKENE
jgi:hypothetical protein